MIHPIAGHLIEFLILAIPDQQTFKNYIKAIEKYLNKKADIILEDIQPGDVEKTFADTENLEKWINFKPGTSIDEGIKNFISWYLNYYKKNIK